VIPYNLAPGASSAPITVATDTPIFIVANSTTNGARGTANMSLEATTSASVPFLEWSGVNSPTGPTTPPTLAGGYSGTAGTNMLAIDFDQKVTLQVADGNHFVVHNAGALTETGQIWVLTAPPAI
jgi:hypothetical protein